MKSFKSLSTDFAYQYDGDSNAVQSYFLQVLSTSFEKGVTASVVVIAVVALWIHHTIIQNVTVVADFAARLWKVHAM